MKRFVDVLISLVLLAPIAGICLLCMTAIRLENPGAPVFLQTRLGQGLRPFVMIKLRTMKPGTAQRGSHEIGAEQITGVGRFLRRTKLDELPQILNVLTGAMSLVGPRPCMPVQTEVIAARAALGVFDVRPGITGAAQIAGVDMSKPHALARLDAAYAADQTLWGDLRLIALTAAKPVRGWRGTGPIAAQKRPVSARDTRAQRPTAS